MKTRLWNLVMRIISENFIALSFLDNCSNIHWLILSGCNLTDDSIPQDIGFLSLLKCLDLTDNYFVNLPDNCISKLLKLRKLCSGLYAKEDVQSVIGCDIVDKLCLLQKIQKNIKRTGRRTMMQYLSSLNVFFVGYISQMKFMHL